MPSHPQPLPPCHAVAQPDLLRGLSILANVPMIVTLLDYEQGAVFQNDLSVWWVALGEAALDRPEHMVVYIGNLHCSNL